MNKYKLLNAKAIEIPNGGVVLYNHNYTTCHHEKVEFVNEETIKTNSIDGFTKCFEYEEIKESYFNKFRKEMPKDLDDYFIINNWGEVIESEWDDDEIDLFRFYSNNCFDTKENAEYYIDQEQRFNKLIKEMEIEFAKGGEIDWSKDTDAHKIGYTIRKGKIEVDAFRSYMTSNLPNCKNNKIVTKFIKDHGEELIEYFKWEIEKLGGKI